MVAELEDFELAIVANQCRATRRQRWRSVIRRADVERVTAPAEDLYVATLVRDHRRSRREGVGPERQPHLEDHPQLRSRSSKMRFPIPLAGLVVALAACGQ